MRALITALILLTTLATSCASSGPLNLDDRVDEVLERSTVSRVGIAYYDLGSGSMWFRNENEVFHAASTMKVPVMMALFRAIDAGELTLDQPVAVVNEFVSIYDGTTFSTEAGRDDDGELYAAIGQTRPLENLIRRMIVKSSNLGTNIVIQLVGASNVMEVMNEIGATNMNVLRGVEDMKAHDHGMNNTATARDLMIVLREIAERAAMPGEAAADAMIAVLADQEADEGLPAGLPDGVRVAHKTGTISEPAIYHDGGIVYPDNASPYVLVVLTEGMNRGEAHRTVAEISRLFWDHHSALR